VYQQPVSLGGFIESSAGRSPWSSHWHNAVPLLACLAGTLGRISPDAPLSHDWPESRDSDTNRVRALELACGAHQLLGTAMGSAGLQLLEYFSGSSSRPLLNGLGSSNATRRGTFYCNSAVCVASSTMGFANGAPLRIFDICHKYHFNLPKYSRQTTL
jgi:hypothetical protein